MYSYAFKWALTPTTTFYANLYNMNNPNE